MCRTLHLQGRAGAAVERGLTVIEVICLLAFAVVLMILFYPRRGHGGAAPMTAAMTEIQNLKSALDSFQVDNGFYPTNDLGGLLKQPRGTTNWHGPYVDGIPKDPWGRDYVYECPGRHTASGFPYDLLSLGPPGASNPIANWMYGMKPL